MKKIIISLTISAALLSTVATYAAVTNPDVTVKQAFAKEFAKVKDVEWTTVGKDGVYEAKFTFNNENIQAFFTEEGEFLGTTRQITTSQLPVIVASELEKQYAGVRITTIYEYSKKDGTSYYITLIGEKGSKVIKASANGELLVYKKNA